MSLFEDQRYQWRETYFVVTLRRHRPEHIETQSLLESLSRDYELQDIRLDEQGRIESFSLVSLSDCAAMDICYVAGEDVVEQVEQFARDMRAQPLTADEQQRLDALRDCDARFEVYHFERSDGMSDEEDDLLDPTTLFDVLHRIAKACNGIAIDPQAGTFVG